MGVIVFFGAFEKIQKFEKFWGVWGGVLGGFQIFFGILLFLGFSGFFAVKLGGGVFRVGYNGRI